MEGFSGEKNRKNESLRIKNKEGIKGSQQRGGEDKSKKDKKGCGGRFGSSLDEEGGQ